MSDETRSGDETLPNGYETDYVVGQDNVEFWGFDIHNPVFFISGIIIVAFVAVSLALPGETKVFFESLRKGLTSSLDWLFILAGNVFVLFALYLIVSPFGNIRLGGQNAKPEFSFTGWLAMLFAAGMGIGLMFFGVAEPVMHFLAPPHGAGGDIPGAVESMKLTYFHWGLHLSLIHI